MDAQRKPAANPVRGNDATDILGGVFIAAIGGLLLALTWDLATGSLRRMGPGFWPQTVAVFLIAIGIMIALPSLLHSRPRLALPSLRAAALIIGAATLFAVSIGKLGLIPALALAMPVAAAADRNSRLGETVVLIVLTAIGFALIFIVGLGLPIRLLAA